MSRLGPEQQLHITLILLSRTGHSTAGEVAFLGLAGHDAAMDVAADAVQLLAATGMSAIARPSG